MIKKTNKTFLTIEGILFLTILFLGCNDSGPGGFEIPTTNMECKDETISYRQEDHGSYTDEFSPHEGCNGWWYITGYLRDVNNPDPDQLYSFQYTQIRFGNVPLREVYYVLNLAVTDLKTGEHFFKKRESTPELTACADANEVLFLPYASLERNADSLDVSGILPTVSYNLHLDFGKGAAWHCNNGVLVMGDESDPLQRTVYYSYPSMPTRGTLTFIDDEGNETEMVVEGKSWYDRQWGPFEVLTTRSHWEWFSLRFFDNEEIMLFYFPGHDEPYQEEYQDGTYINTTGNYERLQNYNYSVTDYIEVDGVCYSFGWEITLPGIKEEHYRIEPMLDGQIHWGYFEMMAAVYNGSNELVGYTFVELLPNLRPGMCDN